MDGTLHVTKEQLQQGDVHVTVLHLRGWLDAQGEEKLLAAARDAHNEGSRHLLLDLAEVETLTSAGMRAMQKVYKLYTPPGEYFKVAYVKICSAPPQVHHILGITGFLMTIPNYETLQAALDSYAR
jgi:anti-anti-sigma factor